MVLALVCAAIALAVFLCAPLLLTVGSWQVHRPTLALFAWFGAFGVGCLAAIAALSATVAASLAATTVMQGPAATVLTLGAWISLGAIGAVIALVSASAEPLAQSHHAAVREIVPVALSREQRDGFTLVRFVSDEPVALAVPGRRPEIIISTALEELLTTPQLLAVLAHEYAHLRYRHGWAVRIAEINALCLPRYLRAGSAFKRATLLLVELIADSSSAKQTGAVHLANALSRMATVTGDPGLDLRAERLSLRRWPTSYRGRLAVPIRKSI